MKRHVIFSSCSFLIYSYSRHLLHPFSCMSYHSRIKDENRFHRELDFMEEKTDVWLEMSRSMQCKSKELCLLHPVVSSSSHLEMHEVSLGSFSFPSLIPQTDEYSEYFTRRCFIKGSFDLCLAFNLSWRRKTYFVPVPFFPSSSLLHQSFGDFLVVSHSFSPSFFSNPFVF